MHSHSLNLSHVNTLTVNIMWLTHVFLIVFEQHSSTMTQRNKFHHAFYTQAILISTINSLLV